MNSPSLSFLIPLYNSSETIATLVDEIAALSVEGGHEIVLIYSRAARTFILRMRRTGS